MRGGSVADAATVPKVMSVLNAKKAVLKPLTVPTDIAAPATMKPTSGGTKVLSGLSPRPTKPLVLYEYEGNADCRKVREACTLLDLTVECRPCPGGTSGYSDQLQTVSIGKRTVPFMIDNNPKMYRYATYSILCLCDA